MAKIMVNPEKLIYTGGRIKEKAELLIDLIQKIKKNTEKLNNCWKGTDSEKYSKIIYEYYIPMLEKLTKELGTCGEFLKETSSTYQELDEKYNNLSKKE